MIVKGATGDKPWLEPMMIQFTDAQMHYHTTMSEREVSRFSVVFKFD